MTYAKYRDTLCPHCHSEMRLREVDEKADGNQDEYYVCKHCGCVKKIKVRYGSIVSVKEICEDCQP